jgi:secreted trypsin-like serine protease
LGDSGGPLLVATPDSRALIQVGTVSYGPLSGCVELDRPIVYMRVSFYLSWIESITGDLTGPPPSTTTTTTAPPGSTTTVAAPTTTVAATTTTTVTSPPTVAAAASPTTTTANASFAAPASGSSGGSGGSLASTGSSGWLTFVGWALVALILGRMTVLVARRPAIR